MDSESSHELTLCPIISNQYIWYITMLTSCCNLIILGFVHMNE